jgi:polyphenol oxidase
MRGDPDDGIEVDRDVGAKFDFYINAQEHTKVGAGGWELAGSFLNMPHKHKHNKKEKAIKTKLQLGLTELLEDIGAEVLKTMTAL